MKKKLSFYLLILFTIFVFGTSSVHINLPSGQVFVGMNVQFSIQNQHPTLTYKWDFGDGTPEQNQTGNFIMHSFKEPKSYTIKCTLLKPSGQLLKDEKNLVVNDNRSIQIQGGPFTAGSEVNISTNNFVENNLKWDFGDGSPLQNGPKNTKHTYQNPGSYTLKAYDFGGTTTTAIIKSITIIADNRAIGITPATGFAGQDVSFVANNFTINNLKWDFGDGSVQNGSKNIAHSFQNAGNYTVKVYDASKSPDSGVTNTLTINPDNRAIGITPANGSAGQEINFVANNFTVNSLKWDFGDGFAQNGSKNISHRFQNAGNYTIKVYNASKPPNSGVSNTVTISPDNRSISFSTQTPYVGQTVNFTASNFASNNLKWDFGNGIRNGGNAMGNKYSSPGNYNIKVSDLSNSTFGEVKKSITINPENRSIRINNNNPSLYQPISFIADNFSSSNIEWDFGDGKKVNGNKNISHFYSRRGQFKVIASEIGSDRPKIEKIIAINSDIRKIEILPSRITVGDFADIKLKNSTVNTMDWKIGMEIKRNATKTIRYQFIDPGNFEVTCSINGQTPISKRITVVDTRKIIVNMRYMFEGTNIKFDTVNFKASALRWDFGDGGIGNGGRSKEHRYRRAGNYTVKVYDFNGKSKIPVLFALRIISDNRKVSSVYVNSYAGTSTEFNAKDFVDNRVKWDFGDGTVLMGGTSAKHLYKNPGTYTVKAIDMGGRGIKKIVKKVIVKRDRRGLLLPQKIIAGVPVKLGLKNLTGNYEWKFDDGSTEYGTSLMSKVFKSTGMVKVTLLDKSKKDPPLIKMIKISPDKRSLKSSAEAVLPKKKVVFTAMQFLGKQVKWNFGDGNTKVTSMKQITHVYLKVGKFKVTASDFGGMGKKLFQKEILVSNILPGFRIETIEFNFTNGKYYRIAQKNQYKLDYNMRIKASGSGILNGKILVDGITLGLFEIYMDGSNVGYLKKSLKPKLPLMDLGMHKLSFEFINYSFSGQKPVLRYFVTIGKSIFLKSPKDNSILSLSNPVKFTWTTPYKYLDYEYAYSAIPFQFLNDNQIKWKSSEKKNYVLIDLQNISKAKYGYLIIHAKDKSNIVKTVSQIYSFRIK